jgi:hypothetical protein
LIRFESIEQEKASQKANPVSSAPAASATPAPKMRQLTAKPIPAANERDKYSVSITDTLENLFDRAIQANYPELAEAAVLITTSRVADYQCNSAMSISSVRKNNKTCKSIKLIL